MPEATGSGNSSANNSGTGKPGSVKRVFLTGGTGFLGYRVVRALLDEGAEVTALVQPGNEDKLGALAGMVEWVQGDVWNPGSLRGRARNHTVVVHLVGGMKPDPTRGLTFRHLNFVSVRNVAQMSVSDGVPHFMLLSASTAPLGVPSGYLESKRDAESYLQKTGLAWTIIRTPPLYVPGQRRNLAYLVISFLSRIPFLGWPLVSQAPISVDTAARGIAQLALSSDATHDRLIHPRQLRRLGRSAEKRFIPDPADKIAEDDDPGVDEPPFGWLPPRSY